jgi:hypothetical protein
VLRVIGFEDYATGPGHTVEAGQVVARFILRDTDRPALVRSAEKFLHRLETELGMELLIGEKG